MRIARRDPPPGYAPGDFDDSERRRRAQVAVRTGKPDPAAHRQGFTPDVLNITPNEPWLRTATRRRAPWERESWMTIAKRDPPPMSYTAPSTAPSLAKVSIKSQVEKVQEDAKKKIDRMMRAERQGEVRDSDRLPSLVVPGRAHNAGFSWLCRW